MPQAWSSGIIRLEWRRYPEGCAIRPHRPAPELAGIIGEDLGIDPGPIVYANGPGEPYEVGIGDARIFLALLRGPGTEAGALAFSSRWGFLTGTASAYLTDFLATRHEIAKIYQSGHRYRALLKALEGNKLSTLDAHVGRKSPRAQLEVHWYARSLREFLYLEMLADLRGTSDVAVCPGCGEFFARPSSMGQAPRYCSNACRQAVYRQRRTQPPDVR